MKEKYLVLWRSSLLNEPIHTILDNLDQVRGALSAIKRNGGVLLFVERYFDEK